MQLQTSTLKPSNQIATLVCKYNNYMYNAIANIISKAIMSNSDWFVDLIKPNSDYGLSIRAILGL